MFDMHMAKLKERLGILEGMLAAPETLADTKKYSACTKEYASVKHILALYDGWRDANTQLTDALELLKETDLEEDFRLMAEEEKCLAEEKKHTLEKQIKLALIPKDKNDDKDIIVEIRAGTGGEEASLFAGDIFRMYKRYSEAHQWKLDVMDSNPTELGGYREIIFSLEGQSVYKKMHYESGTHRVQRVPDTESSGRIHTSAVTVAVLPEAEEVDISVDPKDLKIDVYRSSGPGGQSVNTMDSAVRITYIPTGLVVQCQDGKSQRQNKLQAMKVLRARLFSVAEERKNKERATARKLQVGSGDRSEKIRTYNFPQGRVSEHRIHLTLYKLDAVLDGDLDEIVNALIEKEYEQELADLK